MSVSTAAAQPALTEADYARAEAFMAWNTGPNVFGMSVEPIWLDDDRFVYRNTTPEGAEFILVDPARRTRDRAFDHERLARAIETAGGGVHPPGELPFRTFSFASAHEITFEARSTSWRCDVQEYRCRETPSPAVPPRSIVSPDGKKAAFVRAYNLWVRDLETGEESALTQDGTEDFGYATNNAGWTRSDRPVLLWSPDSRKIATFQHDARGVGDMYLVETKVGQPALEAWPYPLPGDSVIFRIERVIVDLEADRVVRLAIPPDPHRSTLCDHIVCGGDWVDVSWSPDASQLAFASVSRNHQHVQLRIADASTGEVRTVLEETTPTFFESGTGRVNWQVLFGSDELLWFSQRDDWGHLYLYSMDTGNLKHRVTEGTGNVLQVLRLDENARTVLFTGAGREPGRDPYFRHLYRTSLDGGAPTLLTPEDADHNVRVSPSGRYFVDTYARPDVPPVTVLRDAEGTLLLTLERGDISRLIAAGWTPPLPFTVKARDGVTDLYGLMHRPTDFDSTKRYPIVNYIYPGPQTGSVGSRGFSASRSDTRALAELGFIVVQIDAMGTPMRSKSFHAAYYGNMGDNGLLDQVAAMEQLARRHRWIDLSRAGIYGHSGGGYAAAAAILRYPDFFKVAVSQAGNHDNRSYEDDWGEKWQGLLQHGEAGTTNYDNQANHLLAANLKGKLLLAHGTLDNNVPPYGTLMLIHELIRHNKDFDYIPFVNRRHGFGNEPYMVRRRWDYFVRHLLEAEPPEAYEFRRSARP